MEYLMSIGSFNSIMLYMCRKEEKHLNLLDISILNNYYENLNRGAEKFRYNDREYKKLEYKKIMQAIVLGDPNIKEIKASIKKLVYFEILSECKEAPDRSRSTGYYTYNAEIGCLLFSEYSFMEESIIENILTLHKILGNKIDSLEYILENLKPHNKVIKYFTTLAKSEQ